MKYTVKFTAKFKKDYKLALKRGCKREKMETVLTLLADGNQSEILITKYKDHALAGNWNGYRECHIEPFERFTLIVTYSCPLRGCMS